MITAAITQKSSTVLRCLSRWKLVRSNMRKATTMRMPAKAAMGTQPTRRLSTRKTKSENTPSNTPDKREVPPLPRLTRVAPMVPAPGMPPTSADTMLPAPWPTSSRFDRCRLRRERVHHHAGLQRVDGQQRRKGERGHQQRLDRGQAELAHAAPAVGQAGQHRSPGFRYRTDDQWILFEAQQVVVERPRPK